MLRSLGSMRTLQPDVFSERAAQAFPTPGDPEASFLYCSAMVRALARAGLTLRKTSGLNSLCHLRTFYEALDSWWDAAYSFEEFVVSFVSYLRSFTGDAGLSAGRLADLIEDPREHLLGPHVQSFLASFARVPVQFLSTDMTGELIVCARSGPAELVPMCSSVEVKLVQSHNHIDGVGGAGSAARSEEGVELPAAFLASRAFAASCAAREKSGAVFRRFGSSSAPSYYSSSSSFSPSPYYSSSSTSSASSGAGRSGSPWRTGPAPGPQVSGVWEAAPWPGPEAAALQAPVQVRALPLQPKPGERLPVLFPGVLVSRSGAAAIIVDGPSPAGRVLLFMVRSQQLLAAASKDVLLRELSEPDAVWLYGRELIEAAKRIRRVFAPSVKESVARLAAASSACLEREGREDVAKAAAFCEAEELAAAAAVAALPLPAAGR